MAGAIAMSNPTLQVVMYTFQPPNRGVLMLAAGELRYPRVADPRCGGDVLPLAARPLQQAAGDGEEIGRWRIHGE